MNCGKIASQMLTLVIFSVLQKKHLKIRKKEIGDGWSLLVVTAATGTACDTMK
jgi:hypothetical protein